MRKMIAVKHILLGHKLGTAQKPNWRRLLIFFWYDTTNMDEPASHHRALLYTYNGFPGGEELSSQICPLHAYAAKALIHDGCRCFFAFCLTIKRLLFIETKLNITSYNLYYVNLRWEKERKERHDSLYSPLDSLQPQRSEKQKTICSSIFHEAQSCRFSAIRLCSTI